MKSIDTATLVTCVALALPMAAPAQDSPKDKTAPAPRKQIMPKCF